MSVKTTSDRRAIRGSPCLRWALAALLAAGAAAQLACTERQVERADAELEAADAKAEEQARELGTRADEAGRRLEEGLERGAENVERSLEKAAREIEPIARDVLDDAEISVRVKARLAADPDVKALHIDVDTVDGRVTLNGKVESAHQREEAEDLARRTPGVREVVNLIQVVGQAS